MKVWFPQFNKHEVAGGHLTDSIQTRNLRVMSRVSLSLIRQIKVISIGLASLFFAANIAPAQVSSIIAESTGKILVGGDFTVIGGQSRNRVARLNSNGAADNSFVASINGDHPFITSIAVQHDGKIVVGGSFSTIGGLPRNNIARLNSDGTVDNAFDPNASTGYYSVVYTMALQPDDKILVGGIFLNIGGRDITNLARLNPDGTADLSFNPNVSGGGSDDASPFISTLLVQPDGKILVYGDFTNIGGQPRGSFARLNTDGTADVAFPSSNGGYYGISSIAVQVDGKILVGGTFEIIAGAIRSSLARLNSDGSIDLSFDPGVPGEVETLSVQPDNKILVGGDFNSVQGHTRNYIARLNSDGTLDLSFDPNANSLVRALAMQADGKILAGGWFTFIGGKPRRYIVRLNSNGTLDNTFFSRRAMSDFDGDGKTDVAIYRPSVSEWWFRRSSDGVALAAQFGRSSDLITPADYNGDFVTEIAVFRPSVGSWMVSTGNFYDPFYSFPLGSSGDVPVIADYDGDGKDDAAMYRPSTGTWFIRNAPGDVTSLRFGLADDIPVAADFDGDGKADIAVYRPSTGVWWIKRSLTDDVATLQFGTSEDRPTVGDYDGDGRADPAVFRPSTGDWWIIKSSDSSYYALHWGISTDEQVPGDYDGDARTDPAVFRDGTWYILQSSNGQLDQQQFGVVGDTPIAK